MSQISLVGVDGSNPLGFLATLGLLRVIPGVKLGFEDDGSFRAYIDGFAADGSDLATLVEADARSGKDGSAPWRFAYTKAATKKQAAQEVADLKPPPDDFKRFLGASVKAWLSGSSEAAAYAAAYATDVAVDGNGNTKPMAFHFTAAAQTFLGIVEVTRESVTKEWVEKSLFCGGEERRGSNLRWDPGAERSWALMANDPKGEGTRVNAPLEWLAFRGLPLLPSFPSGSRIITTGVTGRSDEMTFSWPLWSVPASLQTVRSVLQVDWGGSAKERVARGIFALCSSTIRRSGQGFGNFGPSAVSS